MIISVIIPTYNNNTKLERLLKSIPDNDSFQIIVVDDNGKENASNLALKFPNVEFFLNENSKGAGGARNTGLLKAKGSHVLFADSDDIFDTLSMQALSEIDVTEDVVYFKPDSFLELESNKKGTRHLKYEKLIKSTLLGDNLIRFQFYVPWSKLIDLSFLRENEIKFEEIMYSNDICFSLAVGMKARKIKAENSIIYYVEEGANSLTKEQSVESLTCRLNALRRYNKILRENGYGTYQVTLALLLYRIFKVNKRRFSKELLSTLFSSDPLIFDYRIKLWFTVR